MPYWALRRLWQYRSCKLFAIIAAEWCLRLICCDVPLAASIISTLTVSVPDFLLTRLLMSSGLSIHLPLHHCCQPTSYCENQRNRNIALSILLLCALQWTPYPKPSHNPYLSQRHRFSYSSSMLFSSSCTTASKSVQKLLLPHIPSFSGRL